MKTSAKLGIVYTPVEVVDFILNSVNDVLQKNFKKTLSDKNVHILDPFTGTGTFLVRLIQSNLIQKKDLLRKFSCELHANEIILLAYYIAAVNIENAFNSDPQNYFPFQGIVFQDTFKNYDSRQQTFEEFNFQENFSRAKSQLREKIEIIIGEILLTPLEKNLTAKLIKKSLKLTPQKLRQQIKILFTILTLKHFAGQATELKKAA